MKTPLLPRLAFIDGYNCMRKPATEGTAEQIRDTASRCSCAIMTITAPGTNFISSLEGKDLAVLRALRVVPWDDSVAAFLEAALIQE